MKRFALILALLAGALVHADTKTPGSGSVAIGNLAPIASGTVLGNSSGSPAAPSALSSLNVSGGYFSTGNFSFTGNYLGPTAGTNIYGWSGTMSGTNSTSTPLPGVNALDFNVTADTYVNQVGDQLVNVLGLQHNFGGAFQGSANALSANTILTAPTANTIGTGQYGVGVFVGQFSSGDNGTLGTPSGSLFGINPNLRLLSNVTYAQQMVGEEIDVNAQGSALTSVSITGTAGQFSATSSIALLVGQAVAISGTLGGSGTITGYTNPSLYLISVTNGTTTFTLTTVTGGAIVTTAGTPTGLTYVVGASVSDIIGQQIVQGGTDVPGRRVNLGYSVNTGTGTVPGLDIDFVDGGYSGFSGVAPNGTILGVWPHAQNRPATGVSAGTTGCGVDFAGLCLGGSKTFTTAAFAAPGFKVDGSGHILNSVAGGTVYLGADIAGIYNGACVVPQTTGTAPVIRGCGVDTNRPLQVEGSGTGNVQLGNTTDGISARVLDCGGACVNIAAIYGSTTGTPVTVSNQTGDTSGLGLGITLAGRVATTNGAGGPVLVSGGNGFGTAGNGGAINLTAGNGGATSGNGGNIVLTAGTVTSGTAGNIQLVGVTTGTNADFLCYSAGNVVLLQSSACTISSKRFKEEIVDMQGSALPALDKMEVASFRLKDTHNTDPNARSKQVGLIAENIAEVAPECAIYEDDMKTPKSYRQECVIALLVKAIQEQQEEVDQLKREIKRQHH